MMDSVLKSIQRNHDYINSVVFLMMGYPMDNDVVTYFNASRTVVLFALQYQVPKLDYFVHTF